MAVSLESQGRVRQRAREIIKNPGVFFALKGLFLFLSMYKKNSDLQLIPFTPAGVVGATGEILNAGALTLYAVWGKKQNTAVDAYLILNDSATTEQTAADRRVTIPFLTVSPSGVGVGTAGDEQIFVSPNGVPFAAGLTVGSVTTGTLVVHSAEADAPNGFVIIGA